MEQIKISKSGLTLEETESLIQELKQDGVKAEVAISVKIKEGTIKITAPEEKYPQITIDEIENLEEGEGEEEGDPD